jgi:hypothetical protein
MMEYWVFHKFHLQIHVNLGISLIKDDKNKWTYTRTGRSLKYAETFILTQGDNTIGIRNGELSIYTITYQREMFWEIKAVAYGK